MNRLVVRGYDEIKEVLSNVKLSGYSLVTPEDLWSYLSLDNPDLLICEGSDSYSYYKGERGAWGSFLIRDGNKLVVILGCDEYFTDAIFECNDFKNKRRLMFE